MLDACFLDGAAALLRHPDVLGDEVRVAKQVARLFDEAQKAESSPQVSALSPVAMKFRWLSGVCSEDVVVAKFFESHLDAMSILQELQCSPPFEGFWGVWAADGPGQLCAEQTDGTWRLNGTKSWCSAADGLDAALVTARDAQGASRLFAVDVRGRGVQVTNRGWDAIGMGRTRSVDVDFTDAPATALGQPGDYVQRRGFWHGAAGIAACWFGAAAAIGESVRSRASDLGDRADGHLLAHLGAMDAALCVSRGALQIAAAQIQACQTAQAPVFGMRQALGLRAEIERCASDVIDRAGRALGAAPLCRNPAHARRVADLTVFMRQSHAERDLEAIGRLAAQNASDWLM